MAAQTQIQYMSRATHQKLKLLNGGSTLVRIHPGAYRIVKGILCRSGNSGGILGGQELNILLDCDKRNRECCAII